MRAQSIGSLLGAFNVTDTTGLTWAHSVNSQQYLAECLDDDGLMMLEGDVQFEAHMDGIDADEAAPFMALDEQDIANLTFEGWLTSASEFNKGVKVDIRAPQAVEPVLKVINELNVKFLTCWMLKTPASNLSLKNSSGAANKWRQQPPLA